MGCESPGTPAESGLIALGDGGAGAIVEGLVLSKSNTIWPEATFQLSVRSLSSSRFAEFMIFAAACGVINPS
jgi:hypothetical protein